jgi:glycopeptide antibiotics resistance protein
VLGNVAVAASIVVIAAATLTSQEAEREVRLRPLSDIGEAVLGPDKALLAESIANILLFVPLGTALRLRGLALVRAALFGLVASAVVEGAQLLVVSGRTSSFDDLVLNTLGVVLGHVLISRWH